MQEPTQLTRSVPRGGTQGQQMRFSRWTMADIAADGSKNWPEHVAILDGATTLTFRALSAAARDLADDLLESGVRHGDRVAVLGSRDADSVVAVLAVCMTGASYVPLDPGADETLLRAALLATDVRVVIGPKDARQVVSQLTGVAFLCELHGVAKRRRRGRERNGYAQPLLTQESVAYLMYRHARSGASRAAQIEHRNVRAVLDAHNERARILPGDRCLNMSPLFSEGSLLDIFLPLYVGATVIFPGSIVSPTQVLRLIENQRVTHLNTVSTQLDFLTGDGRHLDHYDLSSLRSLHTGGEAGSVRAPNEWLRRRPRLAFVHSYSVTELSGPCISYVKPYWGPITEAHCPIGRAHRRTRGRLRNPDGALVLESDQPGELIVAGAQLMRGYFNSPTEDAGAFALHQGDRFYRTRDLAFVDRHGDYHALGRVPDANETSGDVRVLNDISRSLRSEADVEAAFAGMIGSGSASELAVSVVTTKPIDACRARELVERFDRNVPVQLRPRHWAFLLNAPQSPSGRADRERLLDRLAVAVAAHGARFYHQTQNALHPLVEN